jgi:hypothetical protein
VQQLLDTIEVVERKRRLDRFHEGQLHIAMPAAEHRAPGENFIGGVEGVPRPTLGPQDHCPGPRLQRA